MGGGNDVSELSNRDIRATLLALARAITTQVILSMVTRVNIVERTLTSRLRDIVRSNPPIFLGSKVGKDPQELIHGVDKVLSSMGVTSREKVELTLYRLRDIDQIWYTQWKDNRTEESGPI